MKRVSQGGPRYDVNMTDHFQSQVFHCTLASSATMVNFYLKRKEEPVAAIHHLSEAFHLVNKRLSGPEALSENTIAVVICLGILEMLKGNLERRRLHLNGLQRMLQMRGGLETLYPNYHLVQKICR